MSHSSSNEFGNLTEADISDSECIASELTRILKKSSHCDTSDAHNNSIDHSKSDKEEDKTVDCENNQSSDSVSHHEPISDYFIKEDKTTTIETEEKVCESEKTTSKSYKSSKSSKSSSSCYPSDHNCTQESPCLSCSLADKSPPGDKCDPKIKDDILKILHMVKYLDEEIQKLKHKKGHQDKCTSESSKCDSTSSISHSKICAFTSDCDTSHDPCTSSSSSSSSSDSCVDLDDKIKKYIDRKIDCKFDQVMEILDDRLKEMNDKLNNLSNYVYYK